MLRRWLPLFGGLACVLAACVQPPVPEPPGVPSRRLSTCWYRITFDTWSTALSPNGRAVLASAVQTARTNGSRGIVRVVPLDSFSEGEKIRHRRAEALLAELRGLGIVQEPARTSLGNPGGYGPHTDLDVCDPVTPGTSGGATMPPTSEVVPIEIWGIRLNVPARNLYPSYWRDRPLEPSRQLSLTLNVAWPSLEPADRDTLGRRCREEGNCQSHVSVNITGRDPLSPEPDAREPAWSERLVRRAPGSWEGLRFYLPRAPEDRVVRFIGTAPDGSPVFGSCRMRAPLPFRADPSAEELGRYLLTADRPDGDCGLYPLSVASGLRVSVSFAPKDLASWNAMRTRVTEFVRSMVDIAPIPEPSGEPSGRVSSCTYRVAFHVGSSGLSPAALGVIDAAAAQARASGGAATIALRWFDFAWEPMGVGGSRMIVVAGALRRRGVSNEMTHAMGPSSDLAYPAGPPSIMITICDEPTAEALARLPAPPRDRRVPVNLGHVELWVPLVHLNRGLWVNPPIGVLGARSIEAVFDWPFMNPVPGPMRRNQVQLGLLPPTRDGQPLTSDMRLRVRGGMVPVEGELEGFQLFIDPRTPPISEAVLVGRLQDGREVLGLCTWNPEPSQAATPTVEEIRAALRRPSGDGRTDCRLQTFTGPVGMRIDIRFGADALADWRAIYERVPSVVERYLSRDGHS